MKRNRKLKVRPVDASGVDFKGTTAAIVGGTGGIGRAFARYMAARGADVWVVGRTFRDANVRGLRFVEGDLSLMHEAQRVARELPAENLDYWDDPIPLIHLL